MEDLQTMHRYFVIHTYKPYFHTNNSFEKSCLKLTVINADSNFLIMFVKFSGAFFYFGSDFKLNPL